MCMNENDITKLFGGVENTHLFRTFHVILMKDIETLDYVFNSLPTALTITDIEYSRNILSKFITVTEILHSRFHNFNPYKMFVATDTDPRHILNHEFSEYEDIYKHYSEKLPLLFGENYTVIVLREIRSYLIAMETGSILLFVMLDENESDFTNSEPIWDTARKCYIYFKAMLDTVADYEEQLFGGDMNSNQNCEQLYSWLLSGIGHDLTTLNNLGIVSQFFNSVHNNEQSSKNITIDELFQIASELRSYPEFVFKSVLDRIQSHKDCELHVHDFIIQIKKSISRKFSGILSYPR